jgi:inhibitor of KinA sporulation pathway (predicted exonuclease)
LTENISIDLNKEIVQRGFIIKIWDPIFRYKFGAYYKRPKTNKAESQNAEFLKRHNIHKAETQHFERFIRPKMVEMGTKKYFLNVMTHNIHKAETQHFERFIRPKMVEMGTKKYFRLQTGFV